MLVRTGCDVQSVAEVADALRDFGGRYLDRVYTAREQRAAEVGGSASLAARFAGKEAVLKLIGDPDGVDLRSVEIVSGAHGRPVVSLSGLAAERAAAAELGPIDLSLSHSAGVAVAVAVAPAGREPHGSSSHPPWAAASAMLPAPTIPTGSTSTEPAPTGPTTTGDPR